MNWVDVNDKIPEHDQAVFYYFDLLGVNRGKYDAESDCYYGKRGFLGGGEVTHWMPDEGQEIPDRPITDNVIVVHDKELMFTIEMIKNVYICDFNVYRIYAFLDDGAVLWDRYDSDIMIKPTDRLVLARKYLTGGIRSNHSSAFRFVGEGFIHFREREQCENIGKLFNKMYDMAEEAMFDKWWQSNEEQCY